MLTIYSRELTYEEVREDLRKIQADIEACLATVRDDVVKAQGDSDIIDLSVLDQEPYEKIFHLPAKWASIFESLFPTSKKAVAGSCNDLDRMNPGKFIFFDDRLIS